MGNPSNGLFMLFWVPKYTNVLLKSMISPLLGFPIYL
jgi:hypothetical protein